MWTTIKFKIQRFTEGKAYDFLNNDVIYNTNASFQNVSDDVLYY